MASKVAKVVLTENQIKSLIAHRHPFLFVKHAIHNDIGNSITTVSHLSPQPRISSQLQMLEGLGQTGALLLRQMPKYKDQPLPVFAAVRNVKWTPDMPQLDQLLFTAKMKRMAASKFGVVSVQAHDDKNTFCSGELTFSFLDI